MVSVLAELASRLCSIPVCNQLLICNLSRLSLVCSSLSSEVPTVFTSTPAWCRIGDCWAPAPAEGRPVRYAQWGTQSSSISPLRDNKQINNKIQILLDTMWLWGLNWSWTNKLGAVSVSLSLGFWNRSNLAVSSQQAWCFYPLCHSDRETTNMLTFLLLPVEIINLVLSRSLRSIWCVWVRLSIWPAALNTNAAAGF